MNLDEETKSTVDNTNLLLTNSNKSESLNKLNELKETLFSEHGKLCTETNLSLKELLLNDTFLSDLPSDVAPDEVLALIAVAKGVGLTIYVERDCLPKLKVIIPKIPSAITVYDLKQSFRHAYELEQKRKYQNEILQYNKISANIQKQNTKSCSTSKSPPRVKIPPPAPTKINWRYIWKTYVLTYELEPLLNDNQSLSSYGIVNKSRLRFIKRVKIAKQQNKKRI